MLILQGFWRVWEGFGKLTGGRGGIRTHGTLAGTPVFKTGALNHSATLPQQAHQSPSGGKIKNGMAARANLNPKPSQISPGYPIGEAAGRACMLAGWLQKLPGHPSHERAIDRENEGTVP
jgi:hypothetical protein